jgi:hypothetical protein
LVAEARHENTVAKSQAGHHSSACSTLIATGSCVPQAVMVAQKAANVTMSARACDLVRDLVCKLPLANCH